MGNIVVIDKRALILLVLVSLINAGCASDRGPTPVESTQGETDVNPVQDWNTQFREQIFSRLGWGVSKGEFQKRYVRGNELIESVPGILQDLEMPIHGHVAIGGFSFGENGLYMIAASFLFEFDGNRLYQKDVLSKSGKVLTGLRKLYNEPWVAIPWDGRTLVYIWRNEETLVQFAWDGGDAWGIHYRSMKLDPAIPEMLASLEQMFGGKP